MMTVVTCATVPAIAQDKGRAKSRPGASSTTAEPVKDASPTPAEHKAAPAVPMEVFAAEPDFDTTAKLPDITPAPPSACQIRIADRLAVIEAIPALAGPGDCGATDVVKLQAIIMPDKSRVALTPAATLRCSMAEAVALWVREDLAATVADLGSTIRALDNYASYDCRGRNRVAGAKISEHGMANAIDIRGLQLANGKFAGFTDRNFASNIRETIRKQTCDRFTTVLGPGSDGYHESHIHMDLAQRRGGYRLCQWSVLAAAPPDDAKKPDETELPGEGKPGAADVPLPRPRPAPAR